MGHVSADAGYDADPLRASLADDLKAPAQIDLKPSRTSKPRIHWYLSKEGQQVGCFLDELERFRRIALRSEKHSSP